MHNEANIEFAGRPLEGICVREVYTLTFYARKPQFKLIPGSFPVRVMQIICSKISN